MYFNLKKKSKKQNIINKNEIEMIFLTQFESRFIFIFKIKIFFCKFSF